MMMKILVVLTFPFYWVWNYFNPDVVCAGHRWDATEHESVVVMFLSNRKEVVMIQPAESLAEHEANVAPIRAEIEEAGLCWVRAVTR